jgi:hypothetical protein
MAVSNPDQVERFFAFGDAELTDISDANPAGYAVRWGLFARAFGEHPPGWRC